MIPCNWCQVKGHKCHSQSKGGQPLNVCVGCHKQKLSCRIGEGGSRRNLDKVLDEEEEEDSGSNERSDRSGKGWLAKFSTLKVGPPRGVKPVTGQTDVGCTKKTGQSVCISQSGQWERWPRRGLSDTMGFPPVLQILADTSK